MFRQGLKLTIKEELMRTGASIDTLDDLINMAIDIDVKLRRIYNNTQSGYYGPKAMDLSNINKGPEQ
ncbi:hypothetical protein E8E13_000552 [Curvularia kusanoi]|uniref:Uncharacterized protein n=1 Tax=Curvularia kusanoi TaxID=90978 RepID=A0A9P4W4X5_CURKU|nr:hypothetical protein E8E13_000552 [Curvularia kusanoi]